MFKKIIPYILAFALVLPSNLGQTLPVLAADNDGESAFLTEVTGTIEGISEAEETVSEEEEEEVTGGLEEGVYSVPLNAYYVLTNTTTAATTIGQSMPAWNERAMVTVASGGAISITFQIYNTVPYDYFQVMKWEESEKLTFGVASPDKSGNNALAAIKLGTFNVDADYLTANASIAKTWFTEANNEMYEDSVQVRKDSETGYTYLTMSLDSIERLNEKLVIKNIISTNTTRPVNTSFFTFEPENMVRIPDISEYQDNGTKWVQVSDIRGNVPSSKASNLVDGGSLLNVDYLFGAVQTESGEDGTLTIKGELNEESFEGVYGVRYIRELVNKPIPASKSDVDILYYYHPYYNTQFKNLDISDNQFELTFDLTMENLVFGVPVSIKTQDGLDTDFSQYSDEELDKLSAAYCMLHVMPQEAETVVKYDESGEVRLTTDSYTLREEDILTVDRDSDKVKSLDLYQALEPTAADDEDGNPYFNAYYYEIQTASGSAIHLNKNVELAFRIPTGWGENEVYVANRITKESGGVLTYYYEPAELTIEDGYIIFDTNYASGEFYLYLQDIPSDLKLLNDGLYNVKITAMHSSQDGRMSMADSALVKDALLKISTDAEGNKVKDLYMDFQVMYIGDTAGYLSNVGTSTSYGTNGEAAKITWGDNLDYFTVDGSDELLVDQWHKENFDYNVYLVKTAKITLQEYTGEAGTLYDNYYPVYFEVPPMDTDPTDGIDPQVVRLMVNHCVKIADENITVPTYQKPVLKKAIAEGTSIEGEVYTIESYNALKAVLASAQTAYESNPSPEVIKSKAEAIYAAIDALVVDASKMADKSALAAKLAEAQSIGGDNYTASSYLSLQNAITAAQKVYGDDTAAQAEVDAQVTALQTSITALVFIDLGAVAPNRLPDGTYTIPIRLWHAIKDQASMGDAALNSTGILKIENGTATLQMELKPLTFAGLTGYLMQFDTLSGYTIGTSGYPENYTKNPAAVSETYDYVDQYNKADSTDEICRGQKYPKTITINVTLPETTGVSYNWVHVYVPVMGELDSGDQEARLRLDYTAIAKLGEPTISLDHTALDLTLGETKTLVATLTDSEESIVWTSDNSGLATVDNKGLVTAVSLGTATITASAGNISASCVVTVKAASTGGSEGGSGGSGDSGEELKDGTYSIPVKLWHASKNQTSMGNAALAQTAKLVIKNGDGTLYITFQKMTYAGQDGYLAELEPSTVISTYSVVDQFNSETSTDSRVRGVKYPKKLAVPVVPGDEFTRVSVYVPVMGALGVGEQDARLKLDYSSARYTSSSTQLETAASDEDLHFKEGEAVEGAGGDSSDKLLVEENGIKYFYENDVKLTSQLISYWGKIYYAGEDGAVATSQFVTVDGKKYYAGEDGAMVTYTMITDNNITYYAGKGGVIVTSALFNYKGDYYYAYKTGRLAASALITYEGDKYYFGKNGTMVTSKMVTYKDKRYYAYKTGVIATSAMLTINGKKYYAYKTGRIAASTMVTYKGKKYYAYVTGRIAVSTMVTYKGKRYYAYKTGRIAASDLVTYNGKQYYADKTGSIAASALVTYNGRQYYAYKNGRIAVSALVTYKNNQYYVGKDGAVVASQWVTVKGTRYYADKSGKLAESA